MGTAHGASNQSMPAGSSASRRKDARKTVQWADESSVPAGNVKVPAGKEGSPSTAGDAALAAQLAYGSADEDSQVKSTEGTIM